MTDIPRGQGGESLLCSECGAPVHPDPFYQKAHADYFKMNPHRPHVPIGDDRRAAVEALRRPGGDGSPQLDLRDALFNILRLAEPDAAAWQSAIAAIETLLCDRDALRGRVEELTEALRAVRRVLIDDGDGAGPGAMFSMIDRHVDAALARVVPEKETP